MNLTIWNEQKYQEFIQFLKSQQDLKYRNFHSKIIQKDNLIGIKTPQLKKIAKEISNGDYQAFLNLNKAKIYELIMIEGLVITNLTISFSTILNYLDEYIKKIDNWAHVDLVVANLKNFKKKENQANGFKYAKKVLRSSNNWSKRLGILILLNYYLHDNYIDKTLEIIFKIKSDDYYVKMAIAWLLATSYIKYKEKTLLYLVNQTDDFIYNKTISKLIDSRQISQKEKDFLKSLKRKTKRNKKSSNNIQKN